MAEPRGGRETTSNLLPTILLYVVLPIGALVAIYYVVKSLITGGGDAFIDLYKKQLDAYIKKMEGYAKQNNGVLNEAQQASREDEQKGMNATLVNAAQAYGTPWDLITKITIVAVAILGAVYVAKNLPQIIQKWKPVFENPTTQARTGKGAATMFECVLVDQLAAEGAMTTATNLLTTVQTMWNTIDVPQMQADIASLQAQINAGILTGIELMNAQYMVQAMNFEISMMPSIFALPLLGLKS